MVFGSHSPCSTPLSCSAMKSFFNLLCFFSFSFSPVSAQKMKAQFGTTWEAEQGLNFLNTASIRISDLMRAFFWIGMGNSFPCSTLSFSRKQRKNVYIKFLEEKKCSLVQSGKSPGISSFGSRSQRPLLYLLAEKLPFLVHCFFRSHPFFNSELMLW